MVRACCVAFVVLKDLCIYNIYYRDIIVAQLQSIEKGMRRLRLLLVMMAQDERKIASAHASASNKPFSEKLAKVLVAGGSYLKSFHTLQNTTKITNYIINI